MILYIYCGPIAYPSTMMTEPPAKYKGTLIQPRLMSNALGNIHPGSNAFSRAKMAVRLSTQSGSETRKKGSLVPHLRRSPKKSVRSTSPRS